MAKNREMPPLPKHEPQVEAPEVSDESLGFDMPTPPKAGRKPIEVVALRAGFVAQCRKVEGDVFTVPTMQHLGTWMKCTDANLEREHQLMMKQAKLAMQKKAKENSAVD